MGQVTLYFIKPGDNGNGMIAVEEGRVLGVFYNNTSLTTDFVHSRQQHISDKIEAKLTIEQRNGDKIIQLTYPDRDIQRFTLEYVKEISLERYNALLGEYVKMIEYVEEIEKKYVKDIESLRDQPGVGKDSMTYWKTRKEELLTEEKDKAIAEIKKHPSLDSLIKHHLNLSTTKSLQQT